MNAIKRTPIPQGDIVFSCGGIGDSLYVALFIDSYIAKEHIKHLTLFIQEDHKDIVELCDVSKADVVYYKKEDRKAFYYYLLILNKIKPSYKYKLLHPKTLSKKYDKISKYNTFEEVYTKYIFGLDSGIHSPRQIGLTRESQKLAKVKENSVLVMPVCNSILSFKKEFWVALIDNLSQKYNVYVNDAGILDSLEKVKSGITDLSSFSIVDIFDAASLFRYIISVRSGMCDLLVKQECNLIVLYPYHKEIDFYKAYTIDKIPHIANLREFQSMDGNEGKLLEQILETV